MTGDQADLASVQTLKDFVEMLSARRRDVEHTVREAGRRAREELTRLQDCLTDINIELTTAEAASDPDDEEEPGYLADEIEALERRRAEIESAISEIERALARFEAASTAMAASAAGSFNSAQGFINGRLSAIGEYTALKPSGAVRPELARKIATRSASLKANPVDLSSMPLPNGFRWLAIASLDEDLPVDEGEWKKGVSREQMRRSLGVLQKDVLPRIGTSPRNAYDAFVDLDRRTGRITTFGSVHPKSTANVYSVFFGQSPVVADRNRAGGFTVIDGKHRIAVARELGWTHIPAKII